MASVRHDTARAAAVRIVRTLRDAGHVAYFAGGCVRDELLGLTPSDYDVATDAVPDRVQRLFQRSSEVGKAFGVVIVRVNSDVIEVATFRADGDYSDRRRPDSVRFSTPEEDARRRDFTVNALFLDPDADPASNPQGLAKRPESGAVIDHVGGCADLAARVLRAVGDPDQRLAEDHLRALRAVRLAARLGFAIAPDTRAAITVHARELAGVSRERIGDELRRMLTHPARAAAAVLLRELALEAPVLGLASPPTGTLQPARLASLPPDASYPLALAAWFLDGQPALARSGIEPAVRSARSALCLSNDERTALRGILDTVVAFTSDWGLLSVARRKRTLATVAAEPAITLLAAHDPKAHALVQADRDALAATDSGISPAPLLTGDDLAALGLKPGPTFRTILEALYDAQLEEKIRTPAEARELARRLGV